MNLKKRRFPEISLICVDPGLEGSRLHYHSQGKVGNVLTRDVVDWSFCAELWRGDVPLGQSTGFQPGYNEHAWFFVLSIVKPMADIACNWILLYLLVVE